jgi:hypothetical protein
MTARFYTIAAPPVRAVLKPVVYTDIFDYPLTFEEIYQFLECEASAENVLSWLKQAVAAGYLTHVDGYYSLPDRAHLAKIREMRRQVAEHLWPRAIWAGRWVAALPFVQMVAVTGSLAVNNPGSDTDDIDLLIVTRPERLWFCRALIVMVVRLSRLQRIYLCPNYLVTENALDFEQNLFSARQILQMKPIYGRHVYGAIRGRNHHWVMQYFPQNGAADNLKLDDNLSALQRAAKTAAELVFRGFLGNQLEKRLQQLQIKKHTRRARQLNSLDATTFTADVCKGHYDNHGQRTLNHYWQRLESYAIPTGARSNGK